MHMSSLSTCLEYKTYQTIGTQSVPGINTLFKDVANLYKKNPKFQSSLIVTLFKAAIAKEKFGTSARREESVVHFYHYIAIYNPKATSVISANLGGPFIW